MFAQDHLRAKMVEWLPFTQVKLKALISLTI